MSIVSGIAPSSGGTSTSDATAEQWHIKSGKTAYIASGKVTGNGYFPAMMQFDGSSGYYRRTYTSSGNKVSCVFVIQRDDFTGDTFEGVIDCNRTYQRLVCLVVSSNHSTLTNRQGKIQFQVQNTSGAVICLLLSNVSILDGEPHAVKFEFDATAGTASLLIDGADADDNGNPDRVAPTTGTIPSGASTVIDIGRLSPNYFAGKLGFVGVHNVTGLTYSDFFQSDNTPKPLDESTWSEWSSQPELWNEHCDLVNNLGSAGAMTKNGAINVASAQ